MRILALLALSLTCVGCGAAGHAASDAKPQKFEGTPIPGGAPAQNFALRDQNGHLVRLSQQRGKFVLVAFLYTQCEDVCPLIAKSLDAAVRSLGHDASSVRVLAVSVDPRGDTPSAVRRYVRLQRLGPEFHYLIGTHEQLAPVWQGYNVLVEGRTAERIVHSAPVFLLDRRGRPRLFYSAPEGGRTADFIHDLHALLSA